VEEARFTLRAWNRPKRKPKRDAGKRRKGNKRSLSVTISLGVADSSGAESDPDTVLKKADQALYRAKKKGRNRVSA
jgi:diguanylate cyclase (GGDEF)-like protein